MRAWSASLCIASLVGACGIPESDIPGSDMGVPFVCPTNWAGPSGQAINPALVHIEDGELILEASSEGVTVETPLGSDVIGSVRRIEISRLSLGPGAHFRVRVMWANGGIAGDTGIPIAELDVTDTNAHLQMSEEFDGLAYDLPLDASPTRAVIEIETGGVRLRAYFFEAGRHEVLTALSTFSGNVSTQLQLVGLTSQLRVERFTMYNFTTGASVADEFDCDTIGMPLAVAWPVSRYAELGTACTTDAECGSSDRCSDGLCRRPCMTSTICGREVCLAHPDGGGFCRLAEAGFCLGDDCPEGLVCGVDRTCRRPCEGGREAGSLDFSTLAGTCPMNYLNNNFGDSPVEHSLFRCVAGACMDNAEYGAIEAGGWGCGYGLQLCMGSGIYQCNMTGPGFQRIAYCGVSADACDYVCQGDDGNEYRCVTGSANPVPRCAACLNTCGQGEDVVNCANQVVVDCDPAFSWCSHGRGGDIRRRLPGDLPLWEAVCEPLVTAAPPGPRTMITPTDTLIPPFEIDRTEVTRAQYMGFVQSDPVVTNAPVECAGNTTLLPETPLPWHDFPNSPAVVDWCDATAYCAWAGGHLCGAIGGGALPLANYGDPSVDLWAHVCTSGGTRLYPHGDVLTANECAVTSGYPPRDVGTDTVCVSNVPGFENVFDLGGGWAEWVNACQPATSGNPGDDLCLQAQGNPCSAYGSGTRFGLSSGAGFRCCYD